MPSAAWGVATASAPGTLGPHLARYEVTVDGDVTIDLGPLGTLVVDSPVPVLGARVLVQEIPREVTSVEPADTLEALGGDLRDYVQFFSAPGPAIETAVERLVLDAARRAALAMVVLGLSAWVVRATLGPARRAELLDVARPRTGLAAGATAVVVLVAGTLTASSERALDGAASSAASRVFDGTPLEGARLTGRLAGVIDTYGGYVVDAIRQNDEFYDGVRERLVVAWEDREQDDRALAAARAALQPGDAAPPPDDAGAPADDDAAAEVAGAAGAAGEDGAADEDGDAGGRGPDAADGDAAGAPAPDASPAGPGAPEREAPEPVVLLVVSDLHCNVGMARVIRTAAELSGASVVLNAGDTTVNGTAVEEYCVQAFADAVPEGARQVVADGNHDSEQTSAQERQAGAIVLDGEVVDVAGLRVLGDSDPNATRIGAGTVPVGEETLGEAARRLADVACEDGGVDLLLVHNPNVGNLALEDGCVPVQVSGHQHRRIGPVGFGQGVRYVSSSTAGAALDQATIGPLNGVAELTVLRWDPATRTVLDHRLVRVDTAGQVQVGFAVEWPRPGDDDGAGREPR